MRRSWPKPDANALEITEWLLRQPKPFSSGLVINRPVGGMSHAGRLFQAASWRRYAADWNLPEWNYRRGWVEKVLQHSKAYCIRRARVNLYLAYRLRRDGLVKRLP